MRYRTGSLALNHYSKFPDIFGMICWSSVWKFASAVWRGAFNLKINVNSFMSQSGGWFILRQKIVTWDWKREAFYSLSKSLYWRMGILEKVWEWGWHQSHTGRVTSSHRVSKRIREPTQSFSPCFGNVIAVAIMAVLLISCQEGNSQFHFKTRIRFLALLAGSVINSLWHFEGKETTIT